MEEVDPNILLLFFVISCVVLIAVIVSELRRKKIRVSLSLNEKTSVKSEKNFEIIIENVNHQITHGYHYFQIKDATGGSASWFTITAISENQDGIERMVPHTIYNNNTFRVSTNSTLDLNIYYSILNAKDEIINRTTTTEMSPHTNAVFYTQECQKKKVDHFIKNASISLDKKTMVKFEDNFEFSVEKFDDETNDGYYYFQIKDIKGNFKITKITENYDGIERFVLYTKFNQIFYLSIISSFDLNFHITTDVPSVIETENNYANDESKPGNELFQAAALNEGHPLSVSPSQSPTNETSIWYKIGTNNRFADVFFITSDGTRISSHRCILAEFSPIFAKIFDEVMEIPVEINVEDIDADTIKAGLNFLYGKKSAVNGKEMEVFKFAVKYEIPILIEECCARYEKLVDSSNAHEYIQIAYKYNIENFKEKCLKVWIGNGKKFSYAETSSLPQNILADISFLYQQNL